MDWNKAKTMFIVTFLILDIFLGYQLIKQSSENTINLVQEASVEERLKADGITITAEMPQEAADESYVEAKSRHFSKDQFTAFPDQMVTVVDGNYIQSTLKNPYPLNPDFEVARIIEFVEENTYLGSQYRYWNFDKEKMTVTFYQTYKNKVFYKNKNAQLTLQLNDDYEIISYSQTMLENIEEVKKQNILTPNQALTILYNRNLITSESEVTHVDLGYYTLVQNLSTQLFAPTWRFTINGDDHFFINAVEGLVFQETEGENQTLD